MRNESTKPESLIQLSDLTRAFEFRSNALSFTREYFRNNGFFEVETPIAVPGVYLGGGALLVGPHRTAMNND